MTEPEPDPPGPFLDDLRRAHEQRLRRLEFAPQPVIDEEFEEIYENFRVMPERQPWPVQVWRAFWREARIVVWWFIP